MVPIQFEYERTDYSFGYPAKVREFVVVMDTFRHHYSGELMHYIRVDYIGPVSNKPGTKYVTVTEDDLVEMLKTQVTE